MRGLLLALVLASCATPVRTQSAAEAMALLIGCWRGAFANAPAIHDERCFEPLSGEHVVDTHFVRPTAYSGETTYHYDDAAGQIVFAYAASDGGRSNGAVRVEGSVFVFPPHAYTGPDGDQQRLRSAWTFENADRFVVVSEREEDGTWRPFMRITYERVP